MWLRTAENRLNRFWQTRHLYGFFPVWIGMCFSISENRWNPFWQTGHLNSFSPVWTIRWLFKLTFWLNALSHMWHLYGFSRVWIRMWFCTSENWRNPFWQTWHLYGFSLWILPCTTRSPDVENRLLQTVHSNGFSPEWRRLWSARFRLLPKHLPHSVHLYLPLWIFIWQRSPLSDEKRFPHWLHVYRCSRVASRTCFFLWTIKHFSVVNCLSHTVQKYGLDLSLCECSVWSLLSASVFTSHELSPV